jgi:hypothetical protein
MPPIINIKLIPVSKRNSGGIRNLFSLETRYGRIPITKKAVISFMPFSSTKVILSVSLGKSALSKSNPSENRFHDSTKANTKIGTHHK